jgi:hypothetical protein
VQYPTVPIENVVADVNVDGVQVIEEMAGVGPSC